MRKQTKVVAVASAAALLAIGASMTSFAATGWVEEDGTWYWYDKDGNRVEDEWKKSGDNWYWLDSEEGGAMAVDKLVEDDSDTYYVDANGVMVRNTWVKVVNEDQDDDDDPAEYNYYYMQSSGKAYKAPDSSSTAKFKTIDGKRYSFDDDGKMLYGWVDVTGERLTDEDEWAEDGLYYLGNWDDGAMKTGWQKIYVHDEKEDDDMEHWFYFKSNGKKEGKGENDQFIKEKTINGKKYGFDERGVMVYEWTVASSDGLASASSWKYFNNPEDGARVTKGWFKVIAPDEDNDNIFRDSDYKTGFASTDADDETERWYYADGDGNLASGEIKKIKGKYYGFRPDDDTDSKGELRGKGAAMLSGLVLMKVDNDKIVDVLDDDIDSDELDDLIDDGEYDGSPVPAGYTLFYFGNNEDSDGAMKTGTTTVNLDGESYSFLFSKSGGAEGKGRGMTGIDDGKYVYKFGCKIKASSDDKYVVVKTNGEDVGSSSAVVEKISTSDIRKGDTEINVGPIGTNKDGDTVRLAGDLGTAWDEGYLLLNTSGSIVKNKTAARDGDDWYFYVDEKNIKMYTNNKTLKNSSKVGNLPEATLDDWKDWAPEE